MKNRLYIIGLLCFLSVGLSWMITSCSSDDKLLEGVDLRYEELGKNTMADFYQVDAQGTVKVEFRVKSDHPWKVKGNADWYTITPSEGIANEVSTVTVECKANTELDDRLDTIKIQSDYWVGKTFAVKQKGIAYLTADAAGTGLLKSKEQGTASFVVKANQSWSVEVTEGNNWLSVEGNASGGEAKKDTETEVKLRFNPNMGEERVGKLIIFDRNKSEETKVEVLCTQEGIVLIPVIPANQQKFGYFRIEDANANQFTIAVESNGDWIASKEKEGDDWYSIVGQSEFSGNGTITVQMTKNETTAVRIANILFKTKQVEGAEVITKSVTIKQANTPQPIRTTLDAGGLGAWTTISGLANPIAGDGGSIFTVAGITKSGFKPGSFKVSVKNMTSTSRPYMHLIYKEASGATALHKITIGLNDPSAASKLWTFITPWGYAGPQVANYVGTINMTVPHTFGLNLTDSDGYTKIDYSLDEKVRHYYIADGKARTCTINNVACYGAYVMPYDSEVRIELRCDNGSATFEWFEYTPSIDWKD